VTGVEEKRAQTAIQGVAFASCLNLCSRIVNFLRQVLITAYFGLSFRLDAFFVATSIVAIFINTFGDVFDSAGVPSLVKTREREGEESFRRLAGSIFSLAVFMGLGLTLLMVLCFPLAPRIVPGFPRESAGYIRENLLLLLPYSLVFLPYHAIGSFFRSMRAFSPYYLVEFLVNLTALAAVYLLGYTFRIVALSLSFGYVVGFSVFLVIGWKRFHFRGKLQTGEMKVVSGTILGMLPIYMILYGLIIVDRYFASFLEEGAISALFYGYILATAVPMIMNVENVFVTPLSEESDRSFLITRIMSGMWMVSLPIIAFTLLFSNELVRGLFERGAFSSRSSILAADALRFYILGIPGFIMVPVTTRILQIFKKLRWISVIALAGLSLIAFLNYYLVLKLGMGVKGIALATSIGMLAVGISEILLTSRLGIKVRYREMIRVLPNILAGIVVSLGIVSILPDWGPTISAVLLKGALFVVSYTLVLFLFPGSETQRVSSIILESFPSLGRKIGRVH